MACDSHARHGPFSLSKREHNDINLQRKQQMTDAPNLQCKQRMTRHMDQGNAGSLASEMSTQIFTVPPASHERLPMVEWITLPHDSVSDWAKSHIITADGLHDEHAGIPTPASLTGDPQLPPASTADHSYDYEAEAEAEYDEEAATADRQAGPTINHCCLRCTCMM